MSFIERLPACTELGGKDKSVFGLQHLLYDLHMMCLHNGFREMCTPGSNDRWWDGLVCLRGHQGSDVNMAFYKAKKDSKDILRRKVSEPLLSDHILQPIM